MDNMNIKDSTLLWSSNDRVLRRVGEMKECGTWANLGRGRRTVTVATRARRVHWIAQKLGTVSSVCVKSLAAVVPFSAPTWIRDEHSR